MKDKTIELPPLPEIEVLGHDAYQKPVYGYSIYTVRHLLRQAIHDAIEADCKRRGEPYAQLIVVNEDDEWPQLVYLKGVNLKPGVHDLFLSPQPLRESDIPAEPVTDGLPERAQPIVTEPCFCDRMYPNSNPHASCGDCPTRDYKQADEQVKCPICYEDEPHTGTCGSNDPRALCNRAAEPVAVSRDVDDLAHEIWAAAQLVPGEGIEDGAGRIAALLARHGAQPAITLPSRRNTPMRADEGIAPLAFDSGWNACLDAVHAAASAQPAEPDVLPGEAVFGFASYLTGLKNPVTFSERHGAAVGVNLAVAYNTSQGFDRVREDYHKRLKPYPKDEPKQPADPECGHCGGTGDVSGEYPGEACPECSGTGMAPQPAEPRSTDPIGYLLPHDLERLRKGKHGTICEGPEDGAVPVYLCSRAPAPLSYARHDERYATGWNDCRAGIIAATSPTADGQTQQDADRLDDLAHELWAAAQKAPGEGIEDAAGRIRAILDSRCGLLGLPPLTDAMRAVLRNEGDVYGSEDEMWAALTEAGRS